MSKTDYINLFLKYDLHRSDIYMLSKSYEANIYALFEEVIEELLKDKAINNQLPKEFIYTAKRYENCDLITHLHFTQISNRAFMLSDLIDFLALIRTKKI